MFENAPNTIKQNVNNTHNNTADDGRCQGGTSPYYVTIRGTNQLRGHIASGLFEIYSGEGQNRCLLESIKVIILSFFAVFL